MLSQVLAAGLVEPPGALGQVLRAVDTALYVSGVLGQILGYRYYGSWGGSALWYIRVDSGVDI